MKKAILLVAVISLVLVSCSGGNQATGLAFDIYKSENCGCCGIYASQMEGMGGDVSVNNMMDTSAIKQQYGIPVRLQSCHTSKVGDYFVEGHVPIEAVQKLMTEKPDIAGIALPGMPSGSPGMPGPKTETWTIYSIGHDGEVGTFMTI